MNPDEPIADGRVLRLLLVLSVIVLFGVGVIAGRWTKGVSTDQARAERCRDTARLVGGPAECPRPDQEAKVIPAGDDSMAVLLCKCRRDAGAAP